MKNYIVGVTGHRTLPPERLGEIRRGVLDFLTATKNARPERGITLLTSLAEGADTLCAEAALELGLRLAVALPMDAGEYRKSFSAEALARFDSLLSRADEKFTAPAEESAYGSPTPGFFYRQAGIYIARSCDELLAVWDGEETNTPDGAGTWETVKLARQFGKAVHRVAI